MTRAEVLAWLAARRPERPDALTARMTEVIVAEPEPALAATSTMAEALTMLGLAALRRVTARPEAERHALDLLAADAFVTYVFESAAATGADVAPLVARLLREAA